MKKLLKVLLASAMIVTLLLTVLTGCGNTPAASQGTSTDQAVSPSASQSAAPTAKPKVAIWTFAAENEIASIDQILSGVKSEVDYEITVIPYGEYEKKLRIAIASGKAPDIFWVDGVFTANYAYTGALLPLDEYFEKSDFDDYVKSSQDKCSYDGKIYAASLAETSCVLYYNKDLFAKANITDPIPAKPSEAWTYDKLIEAANKLTIKDASGKVTQYGLLPGMAYPDSTGEGNTFLDLNWLWNHGGEVTDDKMTTASGYFDSEKSIQALNAYADLFKSGVSPLQGITQGFETGKVAMMIHNISFSSSLDKDFPDLHYGVMPLPVGEKSYSTAGGWNIGISSQCKDPASAWKVVSALTGKEGHAKYTEANNFMPSRKSALNSIAKLNEMPMSVARDLMLGTPRARPITPAYAEISPIIAETFSAVAYGENVESTVKQAVNRINKVLGKYK